MDKLLNHALVVVGVLLAFVAGRTVWRRIGVGDVAGGAGAMQDERPVDIERLPDPHGHKGRMHRRESQFLLNNSEVRSVSWDRWEALPAGQITCDLESPDRAWHVWVVAVQVNAQVDPKAWCEHLFVRFRGTGELHEIAGLPLAHRGFHDVCFIGSRFLAFDHTAQPAYVHHYVFDLAMRTLVIGETLWE